MRRLRGLFAQVLDADRLEGALARTVRGKRMRPDVAWLLFRREDVLSDLRGRLHRGTWHPRGFRPLLLRDPKPRVIAHAPIEDRVVHTALALPLEPTVFRRCVAGDLACRPGAGTHRAVLRLLELARRFERVVHLDFRSYFASIDVPILRDQLRRLVADRQYLDVMDRLLEAGRGLYDRPSARRHARMDLDWPPPGRGLPMGAVTSQLLAAHVYPRELDLFVERALRVPGYVRYVDDLFLFGRRRAEVRGYRAGVRDFANEHLRLRLKAPNAPILDCRAGFHGLGMRVTRDGLRPLPRAVRRLRGRIRSAVRGETDVERLRRSVAGTLGTYLFG